MADLLPSAKLALASMTASDIEALLPDFWEAILRTGIRDLKEPMVRSS
jgi:hypothetical protein